ncbi:YibE/F family protein [Desulfatitalea alkaliphila]|uniref:YibE/F family protein n=1 Tax=Desulfatitalea alkaliphila TaxID=2929485 RepID=A0AA41UI17_9BACT|nr:YibE/F family protein [Desulfatitalea alkaliphila]MCJ8500265.1 YibE/F family protein [Desulfatitalea alkaliphila]
MNPSRREWAFCLLILAICIGLAFLDLAKIPPAPSGLHARARVVAVDDSQVLTHLFIRTETQHLTVQLLNGPHKGQQMTIVNTLTGKLEFDEFYEVGATILVEYDAVNGRPDHGTARGYYRLRLQGILIGLFGALLIAVAGVTGLKALLSFIFAAMVLWQLYFPLILRGWPPLATGLAVVGLLAAVIAFAVGGLNRRGAATFAGSMLGVLLTCGLAVLFNHALQLHGAVRPYAEALMYAGHYELRLTDIFIASVFIAASGAIMDLAMDIAASMEEIKRSNPAIGMPAHMRAGMRVGRAVIGTMTTTLLLAYTGSHITLFLLFMAKGLAPANLLNAPFVAAEVLNILVGSFGLVTVAPFTVVVSGLLFRR